MEVPILLVLLVSCISANNNALPSTNSAAGCTDSMDITTEATAVLIGDKSTEFFGSINFADADGTGPVVLTGTIYNLTEGEHGFHVHQFGNIQDGCDGAGDHYNPDGYTHGALDDPYRHAGDLGSIWADAQGVAVVNVQTNAFTLNGAYSIVGRTLVVHQDPDDYGRGNQSDSDTTGHSGSRVACGVIGIVSETSAM